MHKSPFIILVLALRLPIPSAAQDQVPAVCSPASPLVVERGTVEITAWTPQHITEPSDYRWNPDAGHIVGSGMRVRWESQDASPGVHRILSRISNGPRVVSCIAIV